MIIECAPPPHTLEQSAQNKRFPLDPQVGETGGGGEGATQEEKERKRRRRKRERVIPLGGGRIRMQVTRATQSVLRQ